MPGQLISLSESPNILLDKPILVLGRHPECDVQLNSRKISRRHCCVAQVSDSLLVRDLGSTNGIRINGTRVIEGRLKHGDELTVGNFRFTLNLDDLEMQPGLPRNGNGEARIPLPPPPEIGVASLPILPLAGPLERRPDPIRQMSLPRLEENDPLDDAEEPVELEDDSQMAPIKPIGKAPIPPPPPPPGKPSATSDTSGVLPDHLTLRPLSGPFPKPPENR
jgi:predicted component of type VI protein secretion system